VIDLIVVKLDASLARWLVLLLGELMSLERKMRRSKTKRGGDGRKPYTNEHGNRVIPLSSEAVDLLTKQKLAFIKQFGREPGEHDPVFFDPDFDTPTPISEEKMRTATLETFERAGTPRQFVYAYQKTGFMPTTKEGRANRTDEENAEYDAALDEYFDMIEPPVAEQSSNSDFNNVISNGQIETKLVRRIAELATHVGISIAVHDGIKWHDRTRDSESVVKRVMHHANAEPILNSMTGKAKPKAAKLLFFDEGRKIELGAVTLQLRRSYLIAQGYLDETKGGPIEELIHNAIALIKLDFAQEDLYLASLRAAARCFGKSLLDEEMRSDEEEES
jgi:hypothetical protein